MADSVLKKEFKERDVNRIRNLVKKEYGAPTKVASGYRKIEVERFEGDIWEEDGKKWTIKNGIKQNVPRLSGFKQMVQVPLTCPNCSRSMKAWQHKKMYRIHRMCLECVVDYEADLRKIGKFEEYERAMMRGSQQVFLQDLASWVQDKVGEKYTRVTEQGDHEEWDTNTEYAAKVLERLQEVIDSTKEV